jgi:peptide/nickel transport system permease protein
VTAYILRRLLAAIPLLFVVSFLVFFLSRAGGRDPVDAILGEKGTPEARARVTRELGLDKPLIVQYGIYIGRVVRGDLGTSYIRAGESVSAEIGRRLPATIELTFAAMFIAILVGVPAGILSAVRPRSWIDYLGMSVSLAGVSIPVFWLGLLLVLAFSQWLPVSGNLDPAIDLARRTGFTLVDCVLAGDGRAFVDALRHLVLPAVALSTIPLAMTARITRSSMLEVLSSDFVRTARAKGLTSSSIVLRHAFRNALVPVVTLIGLEFGYLLGGAVLTETVFDWPGMGTYTVHAVFQTDPVSICGASLVIATTFVAANLAVDVLYAFIDPRVRYG